MNEKRYDEGRILVMFEEDVAKPEAKCIMRKHGIAVILNHFASSNTYVIAVPTGKEREIIDAFNAEVSVSRAEYSGLRTLA